MADQVAEQTKASAEVTQPILVDLGKQRPKRIKALKQGNGKLWKEVVDVLDEVKGSLGEEADGKIFVPVILVYRKQSRRFRRGFPLLPSP
ncbi:MAG: hypothetical protein IT318_20575 [Anaerolineales bacterium]|nr:hypothetical protein [Anaerolineales bacterium]